MPAELDLDSWINEQPVIIVIIVILRIVITISTLTAGRFGREALPCQGTVAAAGDIASICRNRRAYLQLTTGLICDERPGSSAMNGLAHLRTTAGLICD